MQNYCKSPAEILPPTHIVTSPFLGKKSSGLCSVFIHSVVIDNALEKLIKLKFGWLPYLNFYGIPESKKRVFSRLIKFALRCHGVWWNYDVTRATLLILFSKRWNDKNMTSLNTQGSRSVKLWSCREFITERKPLNWRSPELRGSWEFSSGFRSSSVLWCETSLQCHWRSTMEELEGRSTWG